MEKELIERLCRCLAFHLIEKELIERLCRCLAFHLIESEVTLSHSEGAVEDWRAECETARALIREAGFDIDKLYPIEDRPTSTEAA